MALHLYSRIKHKFSEFLGSERAAVSVLFAVALLPMFAAAGMAVDMGRAYLVKQRLGVAADAAGLAVASSYEEGVDMQGTLDEYFNKNFVETSLSTAGDPSYSIVGNTVNVTASAEVQMTLMKALGYDSISVQVTSQSLFAVNGMEVVMVLDNTGSMGGTKMTSLKAAANDLVDILLEGANGNVKIGLVPFTALVNVGTNFEDMAVPSFISPASTTYNWGNDSWWGCVMARPYPNDVEDTDADAGGRWTPFYWQDDGNNDWYYDGAYHADTTAPSSKGPNKYCPNAVTPLTDNHFVLNTAINSMYAYGPTHVNVGAIWGWRLISPEAPFTQGVAYGTENHTKAIILLTDGENTAYSYVKSAYDYPSVGVTGTTSAAGVAEEMDDRLEETCTNIKSEGILVYSITFDVDTVGIKNLMQGCATDADRYFNSPTEDELKRTFREIAKELKEIRLTG